MQAVPLRARGNAIFTFTFTDILIHIPRLKKMGQKCLSLFKTVVRLITKTGLPITCTVFDPSLV